jgi:hypothetical protein
MKSILFLLTAASLIAAELHTAPSGSLTVHEWGTFTSVAGEDGAAVRWDALGGKDDLPAFVNDFGYRCTKWRIAGTVRMETPVIYFYSPREMDAHVKVNFPHGVITEWYPKADYAVYQKNARDGAVSKLAPSLNWMDTSMQTVTGAIEWPSVRIQPGATPELPLESAPSRYYAARRVDAAPLTAGSQHEKFLFYRGVGNFPVPLSARATADGKVVVENRDADPVPTVILFENRGGRLGFRNADALKDAITLDAPTLDGSFAQLRYDLESALVAQGLYPKEAAAMIETWKDSWFEEGSRLIYLVPARAIDTALPLAVDPAPSAVARVFVGRIELITPETTRAVTDAVTKLDWSTLNRYGRFLDPILARIEPVNPALKGNIDHVRTDSRQALGPVRCR